ncbi:MAG: hypothetical protein MJ106_08010 [Lentisphaeria bacterium]|nr:hypothetical protein [Lentisphaeria bacterium]
MIPSDHFVRFYNEVFKFLDARNGLQDYYDEISRHQDFHCQKLFKEKGLDGVEEYYQKIRVEENCDMDIERHGHELILRMNRCPSLSKAINNDAGACPKYCMHCPGWCLPLYTRVGLYDVYDLKGLDEPACEEFISDDIEIARARRDELLKSRPKECVVCNFE